VSELTKETLYDLAHTLLLSARVAQANALRIEGDLFGGNPPTAPSNTTPAGEPSIIREMLAETKITLDEMNGTLVGIAFGLRNAPPQTGGPARR